MAAPRLIFVTGKGGGGKTTIAVALGLALSRRGRRVLLVEWASERGLARLIGRRSVPARPLAVRHNLHAVRLDPELLLRDYFHRTLRVPFVAERLLSSRTFRALAQAAPGVREFLFLERVLGWASPRGIRRRRAFDHVLIDAPATGHALQLLRTPRNLASMVPAGAVGSAARSLLRVLGDPETTGIAIVASPEEMSVNESLEARAVLADDLVLPLLRPVLNRVQPRRFSRAEARWIAELGAGRRGDPLFEAARLQLASRRDAERHLGRLRRAFGVTPACFPLAPGGWADTAALERAGSRLARALFGS